MSKKKRIRRDIEKFERSGRYWDLLRLMESEGLVSANASKYSETWKTVVRQALQQERDFERFFLEISAFGNVPQDPDCRLLLYVKEFIDGEDKTEKILEIKGLSPHGEKLRSKIIAFMSSGAQAQGEKLQGLLEKFIREPGKITRRHFEQAAGLAPVESLRTNIALLGQSINIVRRLNQKPAVERGWNALNPSNLNRIDNRLERISRSLPGGLLDVLLYPYVHNLAAMCLRLAPDLGIHQASLLVNSIPFLLPRVAGENFGNLERKLLESHSKHGEDDLDSLHGKTAGLSIEEKLTMLRDTRLGVEDYHAGRMRLDNFNLDDAEDYEEDDDFGFDFPDENENGDSVLARKLLVLHQVVLKDISARTPGMSPREKKELVRVMEPILFHDLDFMLDTAETPEVTVDLLDVAIAAGCAGVRTGLLALLASTAVRRGDVRKRAEKHLGQSPAPERQDMEWLAGEWSDIYYPYVQSIRSILARYKDRNELITPFLDQLCHMLEFDMIKSAIMRNMPFLLKDIAGHGESKNPGIVRRELSVLSEYDVLDPVREFLRCYPGDRPTIEGDLCWLNSLLSRGPEKAWDYISDQLQSYSKLESKKEGFFTESIDKIVAEKVEAVFLFVLEHPDQLLKLTVDRLSPIIGVILEKPRFKQTHFNYLVRLEKIFAERVATGEIHFQPIMDRIRENLRALAAPVKKPPKTRRGRR